MSDLTHLATADIGPLHCILYRDAEGRREVHLYTRTDGPWSERWVGALRLPVRVEMFAITRALAWARGVLT